MLSLIQISHISPLPVWTSHTIHALVQISVVCLSIGSLAWTLLDRIHSTDVPHIDREGGRTNRFSNWAAAIAIGLLGLVVACGVARGMMSLPHLKLGVLDWVALGTTAGAVVALVWDPTTQLPPVGLYVLGLVTIGMLDITRGLSPGLFFLWGSFPGWAAFVMITALIGMAFATFKRLSALLRIPNVRGRWSPGWFSSAQALLAASTAIVAAWVSLDFSFDTMGKELAAVVVTGRGAACPTALMLLGGAILMAWQTRGPWRTAWQYVAMAIGILATSSVGWARIDREFLSPLAREVWLHRSTTLMISTGMMTFTISVGLPRVLPDKSDWVHSGRRAVPIFGSLFLLMVLAVLIQKL